MDFFLNIKIKSLYNVYSQLSIIHYVPGTVLNVLFILAK